MTRTEEALLAAVIADPADDLPRLAFADVCEERGDGPRAEFVRCQLELARLGNPDPPACGGYYCDVSEDGHALHRDCRPFRLRCRAADLLDPRVPFWVPPPFSGRAHAFRASGEVVFVAGSAVWGSVLFRRGFVAEATLSCAAWMRHGPALVRAAPLGRVTLSCRRPRRGLTGAGEEFWAWGWHGGGTANPPPGCLPDRLWAHARPGAPARRHPSERSALDDASRMALAWAGAAAVAAPPAAGV